MRLNSAVILFITVSALAGCSASTTAPAGGGGTVVVPWANGQAAEAAFGVNSVNVGSTVSGVPTASQFSGANNLVVSSSGTLWVADQANRVLRFDNAATKSSGASADGVLGQSTFTAGTFNAGLPVGPAGFNGIGGLALDPAGNLFASDYFNTRVLRFNSAATKANGAAADGVLGQVDFTHTSFNTTATTFFQVGGVAVESNGRLWVVDTDNGRVLRFESAAAKANGASADGVLGQPDFVTRNTSAPTTSASEIRNPVSIAVDAAGNLYVGDQVEQRVLIFFNAAAKANGAAADRVLGQPTFSSNTLYSDNTRAIGSPYGLAVDAKGTLYVADGTLNRVLIFYNAASKANGAAADAVLGKPDFASVSSTAASPTNMGQPNAVAVHSPTGKLYVIDYSNGRVLRFQASAPLQ